MDPVLRTDRVSAVAASHHQQATTCTRSSLARGLEARCLACLPKADLHLHLEGAMRYRTLSDLARRNGEHRPPALGGHVTFDAFKDLYRYAVSVIRSPRDLHRLVHEAVEDAANCGAVWIEPQFNPTNYVPALFSRPEDVLEFVLEAAAEAARRYGVGIGMMLAASRNRDPRHVTALAHLAVRHAERGVVAFGLAGDECAADAEQFVEAFAIVRRAGLICAPHAGEFAGAPKILAVLDALVPDRIAHGVRAAESQALMGRLAGTPVTLDVSLHSNFRLRVVPSIGQHPLPILLDHGIRCTLGSDDPLLFGSDLLAEYLSARSELSLTDSQLAGIALTSISASGAPPSLIENAKARIAAWLSAVPGTATCSST
jgi:adenosine deaminase